MNRVRYFHNTSRCLENMYRSTINTSSPVIELPRFTPKSVILLSTVSNLPSIIGQAIKLYDNDLQVIVGGVDTIKGSRNAVSELWSDEVLDIQGEEFNESQLHNKNWRSIQTNLRFQFGKQYKNEILMPLANSIFSTGNIVTLFQLYKNHPLNDKMLRLLSVRLPKDVLSSYKYEVEDRWTPLFEGGEPKIITNLKGNLIKTINNKGAANFLEKNNKLMDIKSKETEVYVKINDIFRYQVIAGGGGWGAKADTLVISPDAKVAKNDTIEFYMVTPEDKFKPVEIKEFDGFEFECSLAESNYSESGGEQQQFDSFSAGSELGVTFNGINHKSPAEIVKLVNN